MAVAEVLGVGLAEAPHHGHGQLQAEVSEDGRILMREEDRKPVEKWLVWRKTGGFTKESGGKECVCWPSLFH